MAKPNPEPFTQANDPLAQSLHLLRINGSFYCRGEFSAPWGIDLPAFPGSMIFHIVTSGAAVVERGGYEPVVLRQGGMALVPHGEGHILRGMDDAHAQPLFDIPVDKLSERYEVMRHGGGGEQTRMLCVLVKLEDASAEHLLPLLPDVMTLDAWDDHADGWLHNTLRFMVREAHEMRPGSEAVITRLSDILVIQMIRDWIDRQGDAVTGWLAALRDPMIGLAMTAIHGGPHKPWSVESLAEVACMSRSGFAARFTELVGEPAMKYVTRWRMQVARQQLRDTSDAVGKIAIDSGYESEASFCRAYKRQFGEPPGAIRKRPLEPT
ncbi:MAG: AraC family transcriptional regulator [Phycisphaeraceae bacterium]